jgi:hypothetical protein
MAFDPSNSWLAIGAFATAIAAGWSTIQQWGSWFIRVPFGCFDLASGPASYFMARKAWRFNPFFRYEGCPIRPKGVAQVAAMRFRGLIGNSAPELCVYKNVPLLVVQTDKGITFWYIRGTLDPIGLATEAIVESDAASRRLGAEARHEIRVIHGSGSVYSREATRGQDGQPSLRAATTVEQWRPSGEYMSLMDALNVEHHALFETGENGASLYALPAEMIPVYNQIRNWIESEAWYRDHHVPWRIGTLLTGRPGTGKSTFVFWVAEKHKLPVHVLDLATMSNNEFLAAWRDAARYAPCIVLLEDFDGVFQGRTNVAGELGGGLTFDCLLNALSGACDANGIALFVTSNHPEKLDDALRFRPGRIDIEKEVPGLDEAGLRNLVEKLVDEPASRESILGMDLVGRPAAEVKALCIKVALQDKHKKDAHALDVRPG